MKKIMVTIILAMMFCLTACGSASWGNQYVELINSGEARAFSEYESMKATLDEIREESGATYVYILSPGTEGAPTLDGDTSENGSFLITVDGSEDPDDWAIDYGWEIQFEEAWNGEASAARSAWINDESGNNHDMCWSAFAPVYDSEGNVVCILGIDYPCADIVRNYPEWCRDMNEWNGFENEITGEVPAEVQTLIDEVTALVDQYAKQLSGIK